MVDREIVRLVNGSLGKKLLLIREPPRHGKSTQMSVWAPAWYLGHFPHKEVMLLTHGAELSTDLGRKARDAFADVAEEVFGTGIDPDKSAAHNWRTLQGGGMRTSGVGGSQTGRGADLLILDDLIKNSEEAQSETYREKTWEWLCSTAWFRMEPGGICIVGATPWHRDDYLARIHSGKLTKSMHQISLPAVIETEADATVDSLERGHGEVLWPERWPMEELEEKKASPYYWAAEYQLRPPSHENAEWPDEYFHGIIAETWPGAFELATIAVDASKGVKGGDYSAIVFAGLHNGNVYVDADLCRRPVSDIVADTASMGVAYQPDEIAFESNNFQDLIAGEFERYTRVNGLVPWSIELIENHAKKHERIRTLGGFLRPKRLLFHKGSPGVDLLIEQLRDFPLGDYDDGPDALEMAIRRLQILARSMSAPAEDEVYAP